MADFQSILGEDTEPRTPEKNNPEKNNVAEFNPPTSKADTKSTTQPTDNMTRTTGAAAGTTGAAAATAKSLYDQAKETAGQAYDAVTEKAAGKLDEQKATLTGGLSSVADSVRQVGDNLDSSATDSGLAKTAAEYTNTAARKIEDVASYFETHDVREMARDLEGFARRNPAIFLGAAFGLGFLAARFFKSSSPRYYEASAGRSSSTSTSKNRELGNSGSQDFAARPL